MKKIIYTLFILALLPALTGCNDEKIPGADFNTYQAAGFTAIAGDEEVTLN
ncbi:MAG: hypothetical protein LUE93_14735 [Bacteroides sp.]|nr:hypothetical protein [Bacteroides sp.]